VQRYIVHRLLASIPVLFIVAIFIFGLLHVAGGDPAAIIAGKDAPQWQIEEIRKSLGLDRPLYIQLGIWFKDLSRGNLGKSITSKIPVMKLIRDRLTPSISLAILVELMVLPVAIPLGVLAAWKANTWIDRSIMLFASIGFSIPVFFLGFLMIFAFALKIDIFGWHMPAAGYVPIQENFGRYLIRLIMPAAAVAIIFMAFLTRMTRATVIEVLREDYIRTARAKGLTETKVLVRHALKNAMLPILTVVGWGVAELLGGIVVVEQVFAIPGVGRLIIDAIVRRDYPVIQGAMLMISFVQVFVNLIIDLSYSFFDPRIKY
jgi:peptide/nickel transport system permease protein